MLLSFLILLKSCVCVGAHAHDTHRWLWRLEEGMGSTGAGITGGLWAAIWVLGSQPRLFARAITTLNPWAISLATSVECFWMFWDCILPLYDLFSVVTRSYCLCILCCISCIWNCAHILDLLNNVCVCFHFSWTDNWTFFGHKITFLNIGRDKVFPGLSIIFYYPNSLLSVSLHLCQYPPWSVWSLPCLSAGRGISLVF